MPIHVSTYPIWLGHAAILSDDRARIVAIEIADSADDALHLLGERYPQLDVESLENISCDAASNAAAFIDGSVSEPPELLPEATEFQRLVWDALRRIPPGETRTYLQLSESLERPDAIRAVAGACAANPIAVIIPCHRVVGSDGKLTGYRWGVERKRRLLVREMREDFGLFAR